VATGVPRPEQEDPSLAGATRATGPEPDASLPNLLLNGCIVKPPPYTSSGLRRQYRLVVAGAGPDYRGRRRPLGQLVLTTTDRRCGNRGVY